MRVCDLNARPFGRSVNFLDATEEEAKDLVRSLVNELAIMASCLVIPAEQKSRLRANIACFEAYLNGRNSAH